MASSARASSAGGGAAAIETFCRIRPTKKRASKNYIVDPLDKSIRFSLPRVDPSAAGPNNQREEYMFRFADVFAHDVQQDEIFEKVARKAVLSALDGYNATIFAYGQTGSGKTYTITGGPERYQDRGIIPRALSLLFSEFAAAPQRVFTAHVSYLEIYNESGYDLLNPLREASALEELPQVVLQEGDDGSILLKNLTAHQAASEEEALNLLFLGDTTRMIAETPLNEASTRSHCVFTVTITARDDGADVQRVSKLHIVDLAGSERTSRTGAQGLQLVEAKYINLSLHHLEVVILALHERSTRGRTHIPYRNSMMTSVLRDSLGGNCRTLMIANLNMDPDALLESVATCRFATRVAQIQNTARVNESVNPDVVIKRLRDEIRALKLELALASGRDDERGPITDSERERVHAAVKRYVENEAAELDFTEFALIRECYALLRRWIVELGSGHAVHASALQGLGARAATGGAWPGEVSGGGDRSASDAASAASFATKYKKAKAVVKQQEAEIGILMDMVESLRAARGAGGQAAATQTSRADCEPSSGGRVVSARVGGAAHVADTQVESADGGAGGGVPSGGGVRARMRRGGSTAESNAGPASSYPQAEAPAAPLSREAEFDRFKATYAHTAWLADAQEQLKARYGEAKALGERVAGSRDSINELKALIEQLRVERAMQGLLESGGSAAAADPEEERAKAQIDREKANYMQLFDQLKGLKREIEHMQLLIEKRRVAMAQDFEVYYLTRQYGAEADAPAAEPAERRALTRSPSVPLGGESSGTFGSADRDDSRQATVGTATTAVTGDAEADAEIARYERARAKLLRARSSGALVPSQRP